jgi:DNA polymerase V
MSTAPPLPSAADILALPANAPRPADFPLYGAVPAGFPSPADDYVEDRLDLNRYMVKHPSSTFFVRVRGDSMAPAGIFPDDIVVVDRSLPLEPGRIVLVSLYNDFTIKRFDVSAGQMWLFSENPDYPPMLVPGTPDFRYFGTVTFCLRHLA